MKSRTLVPIKNRIDNNADEPCDRAGLLSQTPEHPPQRIQVVLVDRHIVVLKGLKQLLYSKARVHTERIAQSISELTLALEQCKNINAIFINTKVGEESGIEAARMLSEKYPAIKVIAMSDNDNFQTMKEFFEAGGMGYILLDESADDICDALSSVLRSIRYVSPRIQRKVTQMFLDEKESVHYDIKEDSLTKREIEILELISQGITSQEISERLFISMHTVSTHRKNLMKKLGLHNISSLVRYWLKNFLNLIIVFLALPL